MLRQAFNAMLADPEAKADAAKEKLGIDPVTGAELQALVQRLASTPRETIETIKRIDESR